MKILPLLMAFVVLTGCSSTLLTMEECDKLCNKTIQATKFEGISFARLNSEDVILVEQIKRTEVLQASTKTGRVELTKIAKRRVFNKNGKKKVQFGGGQTNGAGGVFGQSEDGITMIQPAGGKPVLICGETQNPCVVDDDQPVTHGGCGSDFGEPQGGEPLDGFYGANQDAIEEFCEESGTDA